MLLEFASVKLPIVLLLALALGPLGAAPLGGCARGNGGEDQGKGGNGAAPVRPVAGVLDRSHAGTPAPAIGFEDETGQPTSMAAFRGRPALVNLWATWCGPCIIEMPSLDALAVREGDALQVVALSQDLDGRALVTRFFAERGLRALEANLDPQMAFMTSLRLETLPTTILYDAQGKEVWRMVGRADWESDRVARLLDEAEGG
jgi:thiol-disulfide isomerase/thioredoxin